MKRFAFWTAITTMILANTAMAGPPKVRTLIQELKNCGGTQSSFCRNLPIRLSKRGAKAVRPLEKAVKSLPDVSKVMALSALILIDEPKATQALGRLLRDSPPNLRRLIVPSLASRKHRSVFPALVRCLKDTDEAVRVLCAETLPRATSKKQRMQATKALVKATTDWDASVRITAIESLGQVGHVRAVPALLTKLRDGTNAEQDAAVSAFQFIPDPRAISPCLEVMEAAHPELSQRVGSTLNRITGLDFGDDYALWEAWWSTNKDSWKPPVRKPRKKRAQ